jgi:hypothetical protein
MTKKLPEGWNCRYSKFETRNWKFPKDASGTRWSRFSLFELRASSFALPPSKFEFRISSFLLGAGLDAFDDLLSADLRQMKKARTMSNLFERGN